jgi:hypothetical protein
MRKKYLLPVLGVLSIGLFAFQNSGKVELVKYQKNRIHKKFANASPVGKTGAPGEGDCTGCHSGSVQNGQTENTLLIAEGFTPVSSYLPGTTYNVSLTMNSTPAKKGFEAIVIDDVNEAMAGTFATITGGGVQILSSGSKQYASHTSTSNTSANNAWLWSWTAPSSDVGGVTFYVATNKANNNGATSGDVIYLSSHKLNSSAGIAVKESVEQASFEVGYAPKENMVHMTFSTLSKAKLAFNLVDLQGKSVFYYDMGETNIGVNEEKVTLPSNLDKGIYMVHLFINNKPVTGKIIVQ